MKNCKDVCYIHSCCILTGSGLRDSQQWLIEYFQVHQVVLVPCIEASLINAILAAPSQSWMGWAKSEYCLNRFGRSSLLVDSSFGSYLLISFSFEVMISMISFTVASSDFESLGGLFAFFKLSFLPIFPRIHFIVLILNDMSSPDVIYCEAWND